MGGSFRPKAFSLSKAREAFRANNRFYLYLHVLFLQSVFNTIFKADLAAPSSNYKNFGAEAISALQEIFQKVRDKKVLDTIKQLRRQIQISRKRRVLRYTLTKRFKLQQISTETQKQSITQSEKNPSEGAWLVWNGKAISEEQGKIEAKWALIQKEKDSFQTAKSSHKRTLRKNNLSIFDPANWVDFFKNWPGHPTDIPIEDPDRAGQELKKKKRPRGQTPEEQTQQPQRRRGRKTKQQSRLDESGAKMDEDS